MRVLLVDNYDSFTFNLAQLLASGGADVRVHRNDTPLAELLSVGAERVVFSPGPGGPADSGACGAVLAALRGRVPILGVCLGMQLMAQEGGATVARAPRAVHGKASTLSHDGRGLFKGLPESFAVGRYHSLHVVAESLPKGLAPTAWSDDGVLMGVRDEEQRVSGIQFHPESILSEQGPELVANFLASR